MTEHIEIADFFEKIDAMRKAGDKSPRVTIMGELQDYVEKVRDGGELDEAYFENQLWLLYIAGVAGGTDAFLTQASHHRTRSAAAGLLSSLMHGLMKSGTPVRRQVRRKWPINHRKQEDSPPGNRTLHKQQRIEPGIDGLARTNLRFS